MPRIVGSTPKAQIRKTCEPKERHVRGLHEAVAPLPFSLSIIHHVISKVNFLVQSSRDYTSKPNFESSSPSRSTPARAEPSPTRVFVPRPCRWLGGPGPTDPIATTKHGQQMSEYWWLVLTYRSLACFEAACGTGTFSAFSGAQPSVNAYRKL